MPASHRKLANVGLMMATGHPKLDRSELSWLIMVRPLEPTKGHRALPTDVLVVHKTGTDRFSAHFWAATLVKGEPTADVVPIVPYGYDLTLEDVVEVAKKLRVGFIAPTASASHAIDLAIMAEKLGLPHVSPAVSRVLETKTDFYRFLRSCRVPGTRHPIFAVPRTRVCRSRSEIKRALRALGGTCILKPAEEGWGSIGCIVVEVKRGITRKAEDAISWHLGRRARLGFSTTIVQQFMGGPGWREIGFQGWCVDGQIVWAMVTRKEMTGLPFVKEGRHIFDPSDPQLERDHRLAWFYMKPLVQALHNIEPGKPGIKRAFINADLLLGPRGECIIIDAQPRLMPGAAHMANAKLGLPCTSGHMPLQAVRFAVGLAVDFTPRGPARAVVMGRGHLRGGTVRSAPRYPLAPDNVFMAALPSPGHRLPGLRDYLSGEKLPISYPSAGADAATIEEALAIWEAQMALVSVEPRHSVRKEVKV